MKPIDALRADAQLQKIASPSALRKCTSHAERQAASKDPPPNLLLLTPEQRANVEAKERFAKRVLDVLGDDDEHGVRHPPPVRDLALFFGVKRTKLHERMRFKRTDLRPLDAWFEKLDRYEDFERSVDEFLRTA